MGGLIKVSIDGEKKFIDQAIKWCKENDIKWEKYEPIHEKNWIGREIIKGFYFYFNNEEDAMAFKLRWI